MESKLLFSETEATGISDFLCRVLDNDVIAADPTFTTHDPPPGSTADLTTRRSSSKSSTKRPASSRRKSASGRAASPTSGGAGQTSRERLTEEEKKANHIASEQKRRQNIRNGFDQLISLVPELRDCASRSEANVLQKTCEYLRSILMQSARLREQLVALSLNGDIDPALTSDTEETGSSMDDEDEAKSKRIRTYRRSQYGPAQD